MKTLLTNIAIQTENDFIADGAIEIEKRKILRLIPHAVDGSKQDCVIIDGQGLMAAAAYIDSHVHGGNGFDCNDGTQEALDGMSTFYAQHGIAAYFPSTSSDPLDKINRAFAVIREAMADDTGEGVEIMGTHMEGPFINPLHKGCQAANRILQMTEENFAIVRQNADIIKRITIAPEIESNARRIAELVDMGIVISGGHSNATYQQTMDAHKQGMNMITHLFCSMSTITKEGPYRICGMLEAALEIDTLFAEIIADCKHLPDELMRIAFKCKGPDRLMVCSDANRGAGGPEGGTIFTCGQQAIIENGVAIVPDRSSFASSVTPIDQMVRNLVNHVDVTRADALKMASSTPARMMGVYDRKGSLSPGKDADIILLDSDLNVKMTICRGSIAADLRRSNG